MTTVTLTGVSCENIAVARVCQLNLLFAMAVRQTNRHHSQCCSLCIYLIIGLKIIIVLHSVSYMIYFVRASLSKKSLILILLSLTFYGVSKARYYEMDRCLGLFW